MSLPLLSQLLNNNDITLVDAGAKGGTSEFKILRSFTNCYGFEPNPEEAKKLSGQNKEYKSFTCFPFALGSTEGDKTLNIANHPSYSSFLEVNWDLLDLHCRYMPNYCDIKEMLAFDKRISVPVRKLDNMEFTHIDCLKLDTQGTELDILTGTENKLSRHDVSFIKCEVSFINIYENCTLFHEIDSFVRSHGFQFIDCIYLPDVVFEKPVKQNKHNKDYHDQIKFSIVGDALYVLDSQNLNSIQRMKTGLVLADYGYFSFAEKYLTEGGLSDKDINKILKYFFNNPG